MTVLRSTGVEMTRSIGEALAPLLLPGDVVVLAGQLGTGKTAVAQGIARGLGVDEPVVSPSFVIVREYSSLVRLVHVDVYRLDHVQELHDLGFEEVLDDRSITLVEWGDRVAGLLPDTRMDLRIRAGGGPDVRVIECTASGPSWADRQGPLTRVLARFREGANGAAAGDAAAGGAGGC